MRYLWDDTQPGALWVDRGIDGKVDEFEPCEPCASTLEGHAQSDARWQDLSLCRTCLTELEIKSAIDEVKELRPYNLDKEPERIVLEDATDLGFLFEMPDRYYLPNERGEL